MGRTEAVSLEDPGRLAAADPQGMLRMVASTGAQLRAGFQSGLRTPDLPSAEGLRSIVVCGMGGSGVAGDVLRALFAHRIQVPVVVVKGYVLPAFCGRDTLVFASSFSGNTEETLSAYGQAVASGCRVVAVTSGGELAALAVTDNVATVAVPDHVPVPRAALGYLAGAPLGVLEAMGLASASAGQVETCARLLGGLAEELGPERPSAENEAKGLAAWLIGRTPVVWGSEGLAEAPALRWKTQLNENAKVAAWSAALPELDHNEIEGWSEDTGRSSALVVLRHRGESARTAERVDATLEALAPSGLEARQVWARGATPMEQLFSLIMVGDFVATYLAILRGVDPTPIPVLTGLKERLRP